MIELSVLDFFLILTLANLYFAEKSKMESHCGQIDCCVNAISVDIELLRRECEANKEIFSASIGKHRSWSLIKAKDRLKFADTKDLYHMNAEWKSFIVSAKQGIMIKNIKYS